MYRVWTLVSCLLAASVWADSYDDYFATATWKNIRFSADHQQIFFLSPEAGLPSIYQMDLQSKDYHELFPVEHPVSRFFVVPDGSGLVVASDRGGDEAEDLFFLSLPERKVTALTEVASTEMARYCAIGSQSKRLYYTLHKFAEGSVDLWSVNLDGSEPKRLVADNDKGMECLSLSPDEQLMLFRDFIDNDEQHLGIMLLSSQQSQYIVRQNSTTALGGFAGPGVVMLQSNRFSNYQRLWLFDIRSGQFSDITPEGVQDIESLSFAGNYRVIHHRGPLGTDVSIYNQTLTEKLKLDFDPDLVKQVVSAPGDPSLFVAEIGASNQPSQFYLVEHDQDGEKRAELLYDANKSNMPKSSFSKAESFTVKSFDGLPIVTHLHPPTDGGKGDKPLIMMIHGGPQDKWDAEYRGVVQYFARQGYWVAYPNVRGSSGFGKEFMDLDNGDWGGKHIKDILAVQQALLKREGIDAKHSFLMGGSFGGFSVLSLITQYPHAFTAAVSLYGISDLASFVDSWPKSSQAYWIKELGFDPRIEQQANQRLSPYYQAHKISIPLMLQQGANDVRVFPEQSQALFAELQKLGKSVEYIEFADEGHGFRRYQNSRASARAIIRFFNQHRE